MPTSVPQRADAGSRLGDHHRPLREQVADAIHGMIISGELRPGERLQEHRLAELLGVSRNPVREAIRALEATGLIEVVPRAGASVATFDVEDLRQLLGVRVVLEALAAEQAAENHRPADIAEIDRCIEEGQAASAAGDPVRAAECHRDFHLAIERASGNRHLERTVEPLRQRTELVFTLVSPGRPEASWDEHRAIRDAIAAGDGAAAREGAQAHIAQVLAALGGRELP
ncbi:MAG: GntR family transcriptional regulator [Actinomycetota bacterium]